MRVARRLPSTPLFESAELEAQLARSPPPPEVAAKIRDLARDGYAVLELGAEAQALCAQAAAEAEAWFEGGVRRVQDGWFRSRAVRRLALHPAILQFLTAAYGRRPFPFQTLNFKWGSQQALHADTIHFHSAPERFMCGVWIALEDVEPDAGPLIYHPGSHRLPIMTMRDAGVNGRPTAQDYTRHYEPAFGRRIAASGLPEARCVIPRGSAMVWAANLAHGGAPIARPGATRRSLVTHYFFEDCLYHTPMTSEPEAGRLDLRAPCDLRTGLWRWPRRDGRVVLPRLRVTAGAVRRAVGRRPVTA